MTVKILGGSAEEHISKYISKLEESFPLISELSIFWFDKIEEFSVDGKPSVNNKDLRKLDSLQVKLEQLSAEGKSWIGLNAEGKIDNTFLISISYNPTSKNAIATSINASGLFSTSDGTMIENAKINIVKFQ